MPRLELKRWSLAWGQAQLNQRVLGRAYPDRTLNDFLSTRRVDVVFGSWWHYPLAGVYPTVGMCAWIHDFQFLHFPDFYDAGTLQSTRRGVPTVVEAARRVVVSSQDALKDLLSFVPTAASKACVLPFVADVPEQVYESDPGAVARQYHLPEKFIYLPNQFWQHKNHRLVLAALRELRARGIRPYVVCTGLPHDYKQPAHFAEILTAMSEWGLHDQVRFLGLIPIAHVKALMRQAVCVMNPSLFEGWSSTVEEAKSLGKRLLLSSLPVHREQNPPATLFFDPNDREDLAAKLQTVWEEWSPGPDPHLERKAREALPQRMRQYGEAFLRIAAQAAHRG
jgi:glycosyltransferase involved in cell wall biosynthesis